CSAVSHHLQLANAGRRMSQVFICERHYATTVRFPQGLRSSPDAIGNLVLTSSTGALIPLSQVAMIHTQLGESTITRWMNQRSMTIKLNYRDRDLPSLLAEAEKAVADKVSF